jgi:aminopeptidase N
MGGYVNALKVEEIQLDSEPVTAFELNYARLTIPLAQPLEPEQSLTLSAAYTLTLPNIKGPLGYTDLQANFHNWYFFFPPYQNGTGWLVHPPGAVGEHLVYPTADFTVEIASNDPDIQVVGPEMVEATEDTYHFQLVGARAFMWSASPNWVRLEDSVSGIPVLVYVYPEHIEPGEYLLENLVEALALYQDLLGPYPFQTLTVIEFDSPDAMESDALFFLDYIYFRDFDDDARGYLVGIGVHEVCHNWWYSQVGNDQALEPWLDESLSIYCELLFYQHAHSGLVNWWWQFRIDRFEPVGYVDSSIYDHTDFMRYVGAVYMRGVQFLHQLRTLIGDAAFFGALRDYAKQGKGKIMTGEDFFRILGEHTDKDISPLLEEYFSP